ncbi:MAG: BON domain-containing protein [Armatimonadetes bacterium]|nr:BON domain-containing protein [Armatimonadota bacterium]MCX7968918.1 BON domain-containing protein [Armatimonadota bacterium]MDW8143294.1 BON domain-containing protein [Armatimonadota bacterium]
MHAHRFCFLVLTVTCFLGLSRGQAPTWQWHTVQKGETLYGLAKQYQTTIDHLVRLNGWESARNLKIGERIKVPIPKPETASQKPSTPSQHQVPKTAQRKTPPSLPPSRIQVIQVQVGKAVVLTIRNLKSVSVANPEVADVQILSPDHLGVLGKSVGSTTLILIADGRTFTLDVQVVPEPFLRERLLALISIPTVQVEIVKGAIVLSGTVPAQQDKERVAALARLFAATVIDLLKVEEVKPVPVEEKEVKPALPSPEEIERGIGIEGVKVRVVGDSIVLEGVVKSPEDASRAEKIAVLLAPKVVNLLQVRPMTADEIQALISIPTVKVRSTPEAIVVEGEVSSAEELQKLNEILAQVRGKVVNWVKVAAPPPAPPPPSFADKVKEAIGIPTIEVRGDEKGLVLMGTVATQADKERALRIARFMLGLPPVPPPAPAPSGAVTFSPIGIGAAVMGMNPTAANPAAPPQPQPQILDLIEVKGGKQIRVELQVVEINRTALRNLGVEYPALSQPDPLQAPGIVFGQIENPATGGVTGFAQRTPIKAVLQAMERKDLARTLSAPSAVVLSGQEARFNVGGEIPIPVATVAPGVGTTTAVEFRPFGLVLSVIPTVEPNGKIDLKVSTEVSELDTTIAINIGGALIPGTKIRKASTQVELASGETLVMSGLVQRVHQEIVNRVPFLSKIPILGELFTSRKFQRGETELAILVTPILVEPTE